MERITPIRVNTTVEYSFIYCRGLRSNLRGEKKTVADLHEVIVRLIGSLLSTSSRKAVRRIYVYEELFGCLAYIAVARWSQLAKLLDTSSPVSIWMGDRLGTLPVTEINSDWPPLHGLGQRVPV